MTIPAIRRRFPSRRPTSGRPSTATCPSVVVGLPREYFVEEGVDPSVLATVREAVAELERAGAKTREVSLPHTRYGIATYYLIADAEASSNLARYDGVRYGRRARGARGLTEMYERTRSEGFGDEVKRRIILGTYVLSAGYYDAYYRKAQQVRTLLRGDFETAFEGCDVIATPTSPEIAFRLGEKTDDPLSMYLSDIYTVSANLAGIPGISIPCGFSRGMPVGLQLLGPALDEATPAARRRCLPAAHRPPRAPPSGDRMSASDLSKYEIVIGLEVHAQLRTESKLFSPAPVTYGARAQPQRRAGLPGAAGGASGAQPARRGVRDPRGPRHPLHDPHPFGVRAQELLLPGPAQGLPDLPVRVPHRDRRLDRDLRRRRRDERRRPNASGSLASTWRRTRASPSTTTPSRAATRRSST